MAQLTVRGVAGGDAGGLARAWEDARDYYAALDDRSIVFLNYLDGDAALP